MGLFAAVVSYTLPDVEHPAGCPRPSYRSLPLLGAALVAGCLVEFGAAVHGFVAAVFCLALVVVTATDLEYRLIPNRVVGPASLIVARRDDDRQAEPGLGDLRGRRAAFLLVFSLISPQGMGMGDVKLAVPDGRRPRDERRGCARDREPHVARPSIAILVRHGRAGRKVGLPVRAVPAIGSLVALFVWGAL